MTTLNPLKSRGFSIIEMMVSLGIVSIIMIGSFQLFQEGMQLFRVNQAAADSQANITKAMGIISTDLSNASPNLTRLYPDPPNGLIGMPPGLVFVTPLDSNGNVRYDPLNGQIYWQRYISFFFQADPSGGQNGKIIRGEIPLAGEPGDTGGTGNRDVTNIIKPFLTNNTTTAFASAKPKLIADGIADFSVKEYKYSTSEFASGGGAGVGSPTNHRRAFDLTIDAGDKARAFRNSYYISVKIRVSPGAR